jgi:hypothetical protein
MCSYLIFDSTKTGELKILVLNQSWCIDVNPEALEVGRSACVEFNAELNTEAPEVCVLSAVMQLLGELHLLV